MNKEEMKEKYTDVDLMIVVEFLTDYAESVKNDTPELQIQIDGVIASLPETIESL